MFRSIKYEVTFPTGPRPTFKGNYKFDRGFGAIIGPNEAGKSMILEFLEFLLFGVSALRSTSTDYATLRVEGVVSIRDVDYKIERTIKTAKLTNLTIKAVEAVSTKAVNAAVLDKLGFGLNIFRVANAINQGEVEALSKMRPAERQRMVDAVVGLDKVEGLIKFCSQEALEHERQAKSMELVVTEPEKPVEPEGWADRKVLYEQLEKARVDSAKRDDVQRRMLVLNTVAEPDKPTIDFTETLAELKQAVEAEEALVSTKKQLSFMPKLEDIPELRRQIEAFEAYQQAQDMLRFNPAPLYTREQLQQIIDEWAYIDLWARYMEHRAAKDALQARIEGLDTATCPKCDHIFTLHADMRTTLYAEWEAMVWKGDIPIADAPPRPAIEATRARQMLEAYDDELTAKRAKWEVVPKAARPAYDSDRLEDADMNRPIMEQEVERLEKLLIPDARNKYVRLIDYDAAMDRYDERMDRYREARDTLRALNDDLKVLDYAPAEVVRLTGITALFASYGVQRDRYEAAMLDWASNMLLIQEGFDLAAKWRRAKEGLAKLRILIKQHLYPSLSAAASYFLSAMTAGVRNRIEITDNFDIIVDGQMIDTLSGSGKAVANLAVRLGLGRVLTHSVFPVVLADEIDASMDDERATQTADCVSQCARRLSQLLLVSHKTPEADYYIDLGVKSEQPPTD